MYQVYQHQQYPLHGLGTAGHRTSSYLPPQQQQQPPMSRQYNSYYQPQPTHIPPHSLYSYQQVPAPAYNQSVYTPVINNDHQQHQEEPAVNGGINSVLEYNLNQMASFLSWCGFGMLKQSRNPSLEFDQLIVSVLFATRLPKSTIIIALEYMNQRFSSDSSITNKTLSEGEIFNHLIVSLVLANKFNDDNTFTNKSWCGATGLDLHKLNKLEQDWLEYVKWSLNVVNFESNILTLEECWKTWLDKYSNSTRATSSNTTPISSPCSASSPRSALNSSPITRPHSSYSSIPSSPDYDQRYYALKSSWGQQQRQPPAPQPQPQQRMIPPPPPTAPVYNYNLQFNDPAVQYVGPPPSHVGYVGYANPYYMTSC
ncbi:Meiotically up-regulated protein [Spathaspora sp. JA1]|nr:Meiotically up-regulated protein [Spathaspora sp. JA1]